jgi:hypothetical protein
MKKVIFSIFLMIGLVFGVSEVMAQSSGLATMAKTDGTVQAKETVINSIEQKLPILYAEIKEASNELDLKLLTLEASLYRKTLGNLRNGSTVRNSYEATIHWFLQEFPYAHIDRKKEVVNEYHQIIFIN